MFFTVSVTHHLAERDEVVFGVAGFAGNTEHQHYI